MKTISKTQRFYKSYLKWGFKGASNNEKIVGMSRLKDEGVFKKITFHLLLISVLVNKASIPMLFEYT